MWRERQDRQADRLSHLQTLGEQQRPPLVCAIGDGSCPRGKEQRRTELTGSQYADREPAPGELEDEQRESDVREPIARVRDQLADEVQPEVAVPQRKERLAQRAAQQRAAEPFGIARGHADSSGVSDHSAGSTLAVLICYSSFAVGFWLSDSGRDQAVS